MIDAEVVRTLAEFMGYSVRMLPCGPEYQEVEFVTTPDNVTFASQRLLDSYDTLAEVWRRVQKTDPYNLLHSADMAIPYNWFDHEPRDHAYALAEAIAGAKK